MKQASNKTRINSSDVRADTQYAIRNTQYGKAGVTLVEMIIAVAIIVVVFTAITPLFRGILNSWDSKAGAAETVQNGRVLIDHLNHNLSKAVRITDVSDSNVTTGYIEFEDNDGNTLRYDIASSYVEFGVVGDLSDLAGPVSTLQFTCYDVCDLDTPITDVNEIRTVQVQTTLTNSSTLGADRTFTTTVYLRTNWETGSGTDPNLVGWWKLDESSGLTAADSAGSNDGTLTNMAGTEWTGGVINGALDFAGDNDCVVTSMASDDVTGDFTFSAWFKSDDAGSIGNDYVTQRFITQLRTSDGSRMCLGINNNRVATYWYDGGDNVGEGTTTLSAGVWYHAALTYDGSTIRIYLNGSEENSFSESSMTAPSSNTIQIARQSSTGRYFDGTLDDVRVYDRALDASEIAQLAEILTYEEFTEAKAGSDTTSITISTPAGTSEGDLLVAAVATDGDTSLSLSPPGGEGWTEVDLDDYSFDVTLGAWWKLADASESGTHQFTWTGGEQAYGWMMRFTGHDPADPVDVSATSGETSSTPTSPAVTTTVNNCIILRLGAFDDGDITVDDPGLSGHTAITMDKSSADVVITAADFETGFGDWVNVTGDDIDWTRDQGGTPSSSTGPSVDHTLGTSSGWYVYTESSTSGTGFPNKVAILQGPEFDASLYTNLTLDFWYHMYGSSMGSLHVDVYDGSWNNDVWSLSGNQGNTWFNQQVDLSSFSGTIKIRFRGITGSSYTSDMAIDDIEVTETGVGTVSGGAGYVSQSASGGSGTSTFSLGSSNEAQTLTIAIAQNPESSGGGEILP